MTQNASALIGGEWPAELTGSFTDWTMKPSTHGLTHAEGTINPAMTRALMRGRG